MSLTLHLGVVDVPYADRENPKKMSARVRKGRKAAASGGGGGSKSTGDVAEILEDRYHVVEVFYRLHQQDIASDLEGSLSGALESLLLGAPPSLDAFGAATSKIEERFRSFLSNKEMDALGYPGVPTLASLRGVSHRFKQPYKKRAPRPSFIDTGLYQTSFAFWVD